MGVTHINLPEMIRLPIETNHVLHLLRLGYFPRSIGHAGRGRHDEHTRLDLVHMGVPEFALFGGESVVEGRGDHILHAEQAGGGGVAVIDDALADIWWE